MPITFKKTAEQIKQELFIKEQTKIEKNEEKFLHEHEKKIQKLIDHWTHMISEEGSFKLPCSSRIFDSLLYKEDYQIVEYALYFMTKNGFKVNSSSSGIVIGV
jgi:pyruvate-formate lyase